MDHFEIGDKSGIRRVCINNTRKKNALNKSAYFALGNILNEAAADEQVKCVVLIGKGDFFRCLFGLCACCYQNDKIFVLVQATI